MADEEDQKPLDPTLLRVQAKLRRLMLIAGGTLFIGLLAVFVAILYRLTAADTPPAPEALVTRVAEGALPAGARLVSTTISNGRIALAYEHPGGTTLIMIDPDALEIVGRLELKP